MIKVIKSPTPPILVANEAIWIAELLQALAINDTKKIESTSKKYNHPTIRETLEKDFNDKCAYCENDVKANAYARIDHFKPQKIAPEDTFKWSNLILSCEICNSTKYKGDKFPMFDNQAVLIHPCTDEPLEHLSFDYIPETKECFVNAKTDRGQTTIAILGLNRLKLAKERNKYIKLILAVIIISQKDKTFKNDLKNAISNKGKFSAFVKTLHHYFDF